MLKTSAAEFDVLPSGYVQAYLIKGGKRLTLDDPEGPAAISNDSLVADGKEIRDFVFDFNHVTVADAAGLIGSRGKKVEISARSAEAKIESTFTVEVYDDFPNLTLTTASYKNVGWRELRLDRVTTQHHWLNASLADPGAPPFRLWSFHGSSAKWGKDDVVPIARNFSQPNLMGVANARGVGGGIPVVAFWTATAGEAIGHVEPLPLLLSLPVRVAKDGRINASLVQEAKVTLKSGEVFSTPRTFVAVYAGDFYEPLSLYSKVLQREGLAFAKPHNEDYAANWCGWGYELNVTPAQMLGTIPKLKELKIGWATLDAGWWDAHGDWNPRPETFPGDTIKKLVEEFHRQGINITLWWEPLGVEDGQGKYPLDPKRQPKLSKVAAQHPDWLIVDKNGKRPRIEEGGLAALCPALPEVQEYIRKLTEKFIGDWGFDGTKLDLFYTAPACYNPKHRHKSPEDSIRAVADVYRTIFETSRALKPYSVTQICPCGTPPNLAFLSYMDQAVTADPVGSVQVRRRIKMYKALLGPQAAVYGDHVELTEIRNADTDNEIDLGQDFASTVGPGGVVGTKFVWPDPGPHFRTVLLTPEKEVHWKKWIDIYNSKMLSRGTFLDLYITGYDVPEGYAIEKDGKMYYAFFAPQPSTPWKGEVELRGLHPGEYRVQDYENGRDLGTFDAQSPKRTVEFTHHLLLEVSNL